MYVPITTFNIGYPHERPWKRLLKYYSTTFEKCKGKFLFFGRSATKNLLYASGTAPQINTGDLLPFVQPIYRHGAIIPHFL